MAQKGLVKGNIHANTLVSAVLNRSAKLRTGCRLTHAFYMVMPDRKKDLIISDAAVNVAPDCETATAIVKNSLMLAKAVGKKAPKVAILSCTDETSANIPFSLHAELIVRESPPTVWLPGICQKIRAPAKGALASFPVRFLKLILDQESLTSDYTTFQVEFSIEPPQSGCQRERGGRFSVISPAPHKIRFLSISHVTSLSWQTI